MVIFQHGEHLTLLLQEFPTTYALPWANRGHIGKYFRTHHPHKFKEAIQAARKYKSGKPLNHHLINDLEDKGCSVSFRTLQIGSLGHFQSCAVKLNVWLAPLACQSNWLLYVTHSQNYHMSIPCSYCILLKELLKLEYKQTLLHLVICFV